IQIQTGKVASEHFYWDQATVLSQLGVLDIPVAAAGLESATQLKKALGFHMKPCRTAQTFSASIGRGGSNQDGPSDFRRTLSTYESEYNGRVRPLVDVLSKTPNSPPFQASLKLKFRIKGTVPGHC